MLALLLALAVPVPQEPEILQPKTYVSPSGEWRLSVDPSSKFGDGEASVDVTHRGAETWRAELPYTFWEAVVTDAGFVAGYAFTAGRRRGSGGELVIAICGPDGASVLEERIERTGSNFHNTPPNPDPLGVFAQPALDRFVVRVKDPDVNAQDETWWSYRISTGEQLGRVHPKHALEDSAGLRRSMDARAVEGTPLTLVQWYHFNRDRRTDRELGTRFVLVDGDWHAVWTLALPYDFRHSDTRTENRQLHALQTQSGILAASTPRCFELRHVAEERRVTYEVNADPTAPSGWSVQEVARAPFEAAQSEPEALPVLELQHLASVPLESGAPQVATPFHDILVFDFDAAGNVRFVRREEAGAVTLVSLDGDGSVVREVRVGPHQPDSSGTWHPLQPDRWLHATTSYAENERSRARIVAGASGEAHELRGVSGLTIDAAAPMPDGGFVLLGRYVGTYTSSAALFAFDADGRRRWAVRSDLDPESEAGLFSPEDVAIDRDGSVLVLDNIREWIQVFDSDGQLVRKLDLEELWGEGQRYLTDLLVEPSGHWLIHDFHEPSSWLRIDREGRVLARFTPQRENGSAEVGDSSDARVDATGRLWVTDGDELAVLDEGGVARTRFGSPPDPHTLQKADGVHFDGRGRVALIDERSHAVHLYSASGVRELVLTPDPKDFDDALAEVVAVRTAADGRVYVQVHSYEDRHLCFTAAGQRIGQVELGGERVAFLAGGARWSALGSPYDATYVRRLEPDGTERAKVSRRPSNAFFERIDAIGCSSDGALAVLARGADGLALDMFDSHGAPQRTIELRGALGRSSRSLGYGRRWIVAIGYRGEALLVSLPDGQVSVVRPAVGAKGTLYAFDLSPDGNELWCATLEPPALHRFALPD
jgi:hypothetical protein